MRGICCDPEPSVGCGARGAPVAREAQRRIRGDEHGAPGVGREGLIPVCTPAALERTELDLDHHHPGAVPEPLREIEARDAAHRALGKEFAAALAQGVAEVGPEGVVLTDETRRRIVVARGHRAPVGADQIERCGAVT